MLKQLVPVLILTLSSAVLADMVVTTTVSQGAEKVEQYCTQLCADDCPSEITVGDMTIFLAPDKNEVTVGMQLENHPTIESKTVAWSQEAQFECCSSEFDAIVTVTVDLVD